MKTIAIAKKTKRCITEDLGLTEIICPSAVPVTIENINKLVIGEAAAKETNKQSCFKWQRTASEEINVLGRSLRAGYSRVLRHIAIMQNLRRGTSAAIPNAKEQP